MRRIAVVTTACVLAAIAVGQNFKSPEAQSAAKTYQSVINIVGVDYEKQVTRAKAEYEGELKKAKASYLSTLQVAKTKLKIHPGFDQDALAKEVVAINAEIERVKSGVPVGRLLYKNVEIQANVMWTRVGTITPGKLWVSAQGQWRMGSCFPAVGPDGWANIGHKPTSGACTGRLRLMVVARGIYVFADIGSSATVDIPFDGILYMGSTDTEQPDNYNDNSGSVIVNIYR